MKSTLKIDTNVTMDVYKHGSLWYVEKKHNLVVTTGLNIVRDLLLNIGSPPNALAVGKGGTATHSGMETLESEVFRQAFTRKTSAVARVTYQYFLGTADGNVTAPDTLQEAGLFAGSGFNGVTPTIGGSLFARTTFSPIAKDNTITIVFTWEVSPGV